MSKTKNDIIVSNKFIEIYHNFNVYEQIDKMKELSKRELYLLLTLCLDKHDDDNPIVKHNFMEFESEVMEIFDIQDDKKSTNDILLSLITETGDPYIETDNLISFDGNSLPKVLTKEEVRDKKITMIGDK